MKAIFDRICIRTLVTIFMFVGVALFLFPYFSENMGSGIVFLIVGAGVAVSCGLLRCYLAGGCEDGKVAPRTRHQ
jgi:drug/metabolite transporter (DMT)-like permease